MRPNENCAAGPAEDGGCAGADEQAVNAGARDRLHALYRQHSSALLAHLTRLTGCREAAAELTQETFARLLRMSPEMLARIERPDAYLWRVSLNLLRDWSRSRSLAERGRPTLEARADQLVDQVAVLESRETLRRLEAAIRRLKPRTREIFLAHRLHGLSYAQIAADKGISVKGVEKQMSKAIAQIDRMLDRG